MSKKLTRYRNPSLREQIKMCDDIKQIQGLVWEVQNNPIHQFSEDTKRKIIKAAKKRLDLICPSGVKAF